MYQLGLTGAILLICAYTDIRKHEIYKCVIAVHLILALLVHLATGNRQAVSLLIGMLPGMICLLLSVATRQALGYGDAFIILSSGFSLGLENILAILFAAFFCAGIWGLGLICLRRGNRRTEIPFVPFLFAGLLLRTVMILQEVLSQGKEMLLG